MPFNNEIEKTKKEIEVLTAKLALLEEIENFKTPCEDAYKDAYGKYPVKVVSEQLTSEDNWNVVSWSAFQKGYSAAEKDWKVGDYQPTPQEPIKDKVSLYRRLTPNNGWILTPSGICNIVKCFLIGESVIEHEDEEYITIKMQKSLLEVPND